MDAIDLLRSEHERLNSLYQQLKSASDGKRQLELRESLRNSLSSHIQVVESVFYPAFRNYPDFQEILSRSYEQNRSLKQLLQEKELLLEQLMKGVSEHIRIEEEELFPQVRKLMKRGEREAMGRHLQAAMTAGHAA